MSQTRSILALLAATGMAAMSCGCGDDYTALMPDGGTTGTETLRDALEAGLALTFDPTPGALTLHSTITAGAAPMMFDYDLEASGSAMVTLDGMGNLRIDGLMLASEDIVISTMALPPDGLTLTDVHGAPSAPLSGPSAWSSDDTSVDASSTGTLVIGVSIARMGDTPLPLTDQSIPNVLFGVHAERAMGASTTTVAIDVQAAGDFFTAADYVTLSDLHAQLETTTP